MEQLNKKQGTQKPCHILLDICSVLVNLLFFIMFSNRRKSMLLGSILSLIVNSTEANSANLTKPVHIIAAKTSKTKKIVKTKNQCNQAKKGELAACPVPKKKPTHHK
jgi:hypothetical protein